MINSDIDIFLSFIAEISKNEIVIDENIVYSNLITFNLTTTDISHYLDLIINDINKINSVKIIKNSNYIKIESYKFKCTKNDIKLYIPINKDYIYKGVVELINYLKNNNIVFSLKVLNSIRNDNAVLILNNLLDAEKIRKYVSSNQFLIKNLINTNPFMFKENISFSFDGVLVYNKVLSNLISEYINNSINLNRLDLISRVDFYSYLVNKYNSLYSNINNIICENKFVSIPIEVLNYKYILNYIISILDNRVSLKDFADKLKMFDLDSKDEINKIKEIIKNDKTDITITSLQKETFDYVYLTYSKNNSENAINIFKRFNKIYDYRVFTRENNIRNMIIDSGLTPLVIKKLLFEEMKNALINASIETMLKYDVIQLGKALFGIKNNDYSAFTNHNNARNNLRVMVTKDEIDELLSNVLLKDIKDDNYWIFIELVNKEINK